MSSLPDAPADLRSMSAARSRVVAAAMGLFARHGVAGTSLQMIADEIGVTKAAVYHQYQAKEDIVRAATEIEIANVEQVIAAAEAWEDPAVAREAAIEGMVELAVARRGTVHIVLTDPFIIAMFHDDATFQGVVWRLGRLLFGDDASNEALLETAVLVAAISGTVINPFTRPIPDDVLRDQLRRLARRFLDHDDEKDGGTENGAAE